MAIFTVKDTRTKVDGLFLIPWIEARLKYLAQFKEHHMYTAYFCHNRNTITMEYYSVTVSALKVHFRLFPCRIITMFPLVGKNNISLHEDRLVAASTPEVQNAFLSMNVLETLGFDLAIVHFYFGNYLVIEAHQDDAYGIYYVDLNERERVIKLKYHTRLTHGILH